MQNTTSSSTTTSTNMLSQVVLSKYKCVKKLGEGSFGLIYKAVLLPPTQQQQQHAQSSASTSNKTTKYAIKFESQSKRHPHLEKEYTLMKSLTHPHIPSVYTYTSIPNYNILIMDLLGKSLEDLIEIYDTFSQRTVYILLTQLLSTLKYIHDNHIVHRDIKPENFVMGRKSNATNVYVIDFGLSRLYRNEQTKQHFPMIKKKKPCGTARYASINTLNCYEQSRRDDLESLAYVCIYLINGELPWQGIKGKTKDERYRKIMEMKRTTCEDELCKGTCKELTEFTKYVRALSYEEDPQYDKWINVFTNLLQCKFAWNGEYTYEWSKPLSSSASSDADDDSSKCNVI
jgi:serine/threonine protein kinase